MNELVLDRLKVATQAAISNEALHNATFDTMPDYTANQMVMRLQAEVLSHKVAESTYTMSVPVPASPWQHWLHDHQGNAVVKLWIQRHPIRYDKRSATVTLSKSHRFPNATIRYPESLGTVVVVEQGDLTYG